MELNNSYNGVTEQDILAMSEDDLRNALLRLIKLKTVNSEAYYPTDVFLPDDVADVLRGRDLERLIDIE